MPVRSLSSSVLKWPDARTVDTSARVWADKVAAGSPAVLRIGYFGSYARGDWGVGSDLDLLVIVQSSDVPFERRSLAWDVSALPVPVDLLVYTAAEWEALLAAGAFAQRIAREAVWLY